MSEIKSFRDLDAWQVAMHVVELTYRVTDGFPDGERYGLVSQMRRASISVPSNIAEGQAVRAPRWCLRHLVTAIGSLSELETQLEMARRLRLASEKDACHLQREVDRARQLLYGLRRGKERQLGLSVVSITGLVLFLLVCVLAYPLLLY